MKRNHYQRTHQIITTALQTLTKEYGIIPTNEQIAKATGLSRQTIAVHLKHGFNSHLNNDLKEKNALLVQSALEQMYILGMQGNLKALALFIRLSSPHLSHINLNEFNTSQEVKEIQPKNVKTLKVI